MHGSDAQQQCSNNTATTASTAKCGGYQSKEKAEQKRKEQSTAAAPDNEQVETFFQPFEIAPHFFKYCSCAALLSVHQKAYDV